MAEGEEARKRLAVALAIVKTIQTEGRAAKQRQNLNLDDCSRSKKMRPLQDELQHMRDDVMGWLMPAFPCACQASGTPHLNFQLDESMKVNAFLRAVRFLGTVKQVQHSGSVFDFVKKGDEIKEQLAMVVDFMTDLIIEANDSGSKQYRLWIKQAGEFVKCWVDRIVQNNLVADKDYASDLIEKLASRVVIKIMGFLGEKSACDNRSSNKEVLIELGTHPFIGQRLLLLVTRKISLVAEKLAFADPFAEGISDIYENVYFLLQVVEKTCLNMKLWAKDHKLDMHLLEEWVNCYLQIKKAMAGPGHWNLLFVHYTDRICGQMMKELHVLSCMEEDETTQNINHIALTRLMGMATDATAGLAGALKPFLDITEEQWEKTIRVNIHGVWVLAKALARRMQARQIGSSFIFMTSNSRF